jgi:hypothetical protein
MWGRHELNSAYACSKILSDVLMKIQKMHLD